MTEMYMRFETIDEVATKHTVGANFEETTVDDQARGIMQFLPDGWQSQEGQDALAAVQMNRDRVMQNAQIAHAQAKGLGDINMNGQHAQQSIASSIAALRT
ncbi:hypothetical protein E1263_06185 [Kribbella antibiotica]|uniref:Uncharacterized protein n=1 Tax=Kribbella antibiotica TaxID=190195 RepID=A0A4R4ZRW3_9ACTN|nr:hypothetical protein [Kribbella antibiotica]TDD61778.1 hypothetical protein E1263_06185 [Kribbella antibiotica]